MNKFNHWLEVKGTWDGSLKAVTVQKSCFQSLSRSCMRVAAHPAERAVWADCRAAFVWKISATSGLISFDFSATNHRGGGA